MKAVSARLVLRCAPSMTIARAFLIRFLGGFRSKPRAYAAVPVMPGQRQAPEDLFLRWLTSFQTGLPRSCSGSMPSLGPGIPFAKQRG